MGAVGSGKQVRAEPAYWNGHEHHDGHDDDDDDDRDDDDDGRKIIIL